MWSWIARYWRGLLRAHDLRYEWGNCLFNTLLHGGSLASARLRFFNFVRRQDHWTADLTEAELLRFCRSLEGEDNEAP